MSNHHLKKIQLKDGTPAVRFKLNESGISGFTRPYAPPPAYATIYKGKAPLFGYKIRTEGPAKGANPYVLQGLCSFMEVSEIYSDRAFSPNLARFFDLLNSL